MEARNDQFRSAHVLRHTFRPSEYLAGKLQQFVNIQEGAMPSRFILTSTREVAIPEADFQNYRYNLELQQLEQTFHHAAGSIALQSAQYHIEFDMRRRPQRLMLRFTPVDTAAFAALTAPIDEVSNISDRNDRGGEYFVRLQLDARHLVGRESLKRAWSDLREGLNDDATHSFHTILPNDISGPVRTIAKPQGIRYDTLYDAL